MAVINPKVLQDADRLEQHFSISESGNPVFDADFLTRTLPSNLSQSTLNEVADHIDHVGHVVDVIVARAAINRAKDDPDFKETSTSLKLADRLTYNTRWDRSAKVATESGHREARGVVSSSLSMRTDTDRANTYSALEEMANAMLGG